MNTIGSMVFLNAAGINLIGFSGARARSAWIRVFRIIREHVAGSTLRAPVIARDHIAADQFAFESQVVGGVTRAAADANVGPCPAIYGNFNMAEIQRPPIYAKARLQHAA